MSPEPIRRRRAVAHHPVAVAIPAPGHVIPWRVLLAGLAVLLTLLATSAVRMARSASNEAPLRVSAPTVQLQAGSQTTIPVAVHIQPDWHIYSAQPLVAGVAPAQLAVTPPAGLQVGAIRMPAPRRIHVDGLNSDANVFKGNVKVLVSVKALAGTRPDRYVCDGTLRYQACSGSRCLMPATVHFRLPVTVVR